MNDTNLISIERLGPPAVSREEPNGTLHIWSRPPIVLTRIRGHGTKAIAEQLVRHYRAHYEQYEAVVTINEWSSVSDYDPESRKILQQLTREMRGKQKEIIIHLGKAHSLIQGVVRTTVKALTLFHPMNIEIYDDTAEFETRVSEILTKYHQDE